MMTGLVAIVMLANFVLAGLVGVRLLRMSSEEHFSPERLLGLYLVIGVTLGGILISVAYGTWSASGGTDSSTWLTVVHGMSQWCLAVGYISVIGFTWRTFHREAAWARWAVGLLAALLAISLGGRSMSEGWGISVDPGAYHWLAYVVRIAGLLWMGAASFYYWLQMKKRLALGLADALVVNRFALWGLFALATTLTALAEPIARLVYWLTAGGATETAASITDVGGPIIQMTLFLTSISVMLTVAALLLTFFPPQVYARWVEGRRA